MRDWDGANQQRVPVDQWKRRVLERARTNKRRWGAEEDGEESARNEGEVVMVVERQDGTRWKRVLIRTSSDAPDPGGDIEPTTIRE